MFKLYNKNILLTGAAGLLGSEFVKTLIISGANCYAVDINTSKLENLLKHRKFKNKLKIFKLDITDTSQLQKLYNTLIEKKVFIDTLINNAANNFAFEKKMKMTWERDINLNLTSVKNLIEIFSKLMKQKKIGNIINIGSDLSIIAPDQRIYKHMNYIKPLSYSVTKHGIIGITKYYASLLAPFNIRVNCLCPGGVFNNQNKFFVKKIKKLIPLNRMAYKDEYNGAINFMCSDQSSYMTGHNLIIDGGRTII